MYSAADRRCGLTMLYKDILSAVAITLTFVAFYPYLRGIVRGTTKPHVFSWIIWGSTTFVVFLAQLQAGGGVGAAFYAADRA